MDFLRAKAFPGRGLFDIGSVRDFVRRHAGGVVVDPFAGDCSAANFLDCADYVSNDMEQSSPASSHLDALEFLRSLPAQSADTIILNPPRGQRQLSAYYRSSGAGHAPTRYSFWSALKDEAARVLRPGGCAMTFGLNSNGIGQRRGFSADELLIVSYGGCNNDTLCLAERKDVGLWD